MIAACGGRIVTELNGQTRVLLCAKELLKNHKHGICAIQKFIYFGIEIY
jgi:hypothetical protein